MQTQTHLLLASAALGRTGTPREQAAILGGAFLPDLSIYVLAAWAMLARVEPEAVWGELYWGEPWQTLSALSNSVFAWGALAAGARLLGARALGLLGLAGLLHVAFDLPFHAEDAHRHFWPLTDWRFASPVSYWDPAHHGRIVGVLEAAGGVGLCIVLWRRHGARWVRALLALLGLAYLAVPLFWMMTLG